MRVVVLGLCCVALAGAVEDTPVPGPNVAAGATDIAVIDRPPPPRPGHDEPVSPAAPCVLSFDWDTYRTVIVVGEGVGLVKPAWVTTFENGAFHVGYRATAFRDARGRLHIDARHARDVGPQAENWIPDSFAFGDKVLWTLDDQGSGHTADMGTTLAAASDRAAWQAELQKVQALIEGGL